MDLPAWWPHVLVKLNVVGSVDVPGLVDADQEENSPARTAIRERSRDSHWVLGSPSSRRFLVRHFYLRADDLRATPLLCMLVHFGELTEGVPGVVHAGATAALLDHAAIVWSYAHGGVATYLTAKLTIDYIARISSCATYAIVAEKQPDEPTSSSPSRIEARRSRWTVNLRLVDGNGTIYSKASALIGRRERPSPSL